MAYSDLVQPQSPPSTYAIAAWLDGEQGGGARVAGLTLERAFFIGTGLWLSGLRGRELVQGALMASTAVTTWIVADYALKKRGIGSLTPWSE